MQSFDEKRTHDLATVKEPSIIITKTVKGNITTVLDKKWYKIKKMLVDPET